MGIISLNVLDEYAKRLTPKQMHKLYENRCGKKFKKVLNESTEPYRFYLNAYTITSETGKAKADFAMWLLENYSDLMNKISYKVEPDAIVFKTPDRNLYMKLQESLMAGGIDSDTIIETRDEKY